MFGGQLSGAHFFLPNNKHLANRHDFSHLMHYPADLPADKTLPPPVIAVSPLKRTVTVFHVRNEVEKHAIIYYNFNSYNYEK